MFDLEIEELKKARKEEKQAKKRDKQVHGSSKKGRKARKVKKANERAIREKKIEELNQSKRKANFKKERVTVKQSRSCSKTEENEGPMRKATEDEGPMHIRGGAGNGRMQKMMRHYLTNDIKAKPTEVPGSVMLNCPYNCGRKFKSAQGLSIHVKAKHEAKGDVAQKAKSGGKVKLVVTTPGGSKKRLPASEARAQGYLSPPTCTVLELSDDDSSKSDNERPHKRPNLRAAKSASSAGYQPHGGKFTFCCISLVDSAHNFVRFTNQNFWKR